jgi:RimJ/RimL family protein N-acetyltransferase
MNGRPSLYEDLVMARRVMMEGQAKSTTLTIKMSSNPPSPSLFKANYLRFQAYHVTYSVNVPGRPNAGAESFTKSACSQIPKIFEVNIPETLKNYSRSYARVFTTLATKGVKEFDTMDEIYKTYPTGTFGSSVILNPYLPSDPQSLALASDFALNTSGAPFEGHPSFDPSTVWGFLPSTGGPFSNLNDVHSSPLFGVGKDSCVILCLDIVTRKCVGAIKLTEDDPSNLSVKMECGIWTPTYQGKVQEVEAGYLVLGKLFGMGYRRVQYDCDIDDSEGRRLAGRLGFTVEGEKMKDVLIEVDEDTVVSRNSFSFALLNSDWNAEGGARDHVFEKIYGRSALKVDKGRRKEDEEDDNELVVKAERERAKEKKGGEVPGLQSEEQKKKS